MATGEQEQIETERKYDVPGGFVLPDLAGSGSAVSMAPPDVQELAATYYDTDDLRLIGAHITLRRVEEHCLPLESARAQVAYGQPSAINRLLILNAEPHPERGTVLLLREAIGF